MAANRKEIVNFLQPQTLEEALRAAEILAASTMVPKDYRDKPGDVLVAGALSAELGVSWLTGLQNIAVINGRPCVWGDLGLALVKRHPEFDGMDERYDEETRTHYCTIRRRGQPAVTQSFSWADACQAGLNDKDTYKGYRRRMLQWRARSWAMRDQFPDALKGMSVAEEMIDVTPRGEEPSLEEATKAASIEPKRGMAALADAMKGRSELTAIAGPRVKSEHPEGSAEWWTDNIRQQATPGKLEMVGFELRASDPSLHERLREVYADRLDELRGAGNGAA